MKTSKGTPYSLDRMISIALDLSAEKNFDRLMKKILSEAMDTCGCDAGTVYLFDGSFLHFHTFITRSQGRSGKADLPPVPMDRAHVCACCAIDHKKINIADVYTSDEYDFKGAQKYDEINGYRTGSMLVIPMTDEKDDVVGVLQLINALDDKGEIIPFDEDYEEIVQALASLAAVSINNHKLAQEINDLLNSFVQVMVDAIDTRTPYNATHTKSMVKYGERFIDWLEETGNEWTFSDDEKSAFLMSVWLHDIGKLLVPANVLDKPDRLDGIGEAIKNRVEIGCLREELEALKDPGSADIHRKKAEELKDAWTVISDANGRSFLDDEIYEKLSAIGKLTCSDASGEQIPLLSEKELESVTVRRGTLTDEEKSEVEMHVVYTARMLERMNFKGIYENVPHMAGAHHEFLDGSGYPNRLVDMDLSKEIRLLTVLDIYDALTAEDRPYKPPIKPEKAFAILYDMCDQGKLDRGIVRLFEESGVWSKEK